jgi:hypothetical protein
MTIIKRRSHSSDSIEKLANELADKPYGSKLIEMSNDLSRTTISLPSSILFKLEDMAKINKREKKPLKSVSAIIRSYIEKNL